MNAFVGSPLFSILIVLSIIGVGVALRMGLGPTNTEYKHKPDVE